LPLQGGGPAATAVVAASRLGAETAFLGVVGDDQAGEEILRSFRKENVETKHIRIKIGKESAVAYCWVEQQSGKRSIVWSKGTAMPLDAEDVDMDFVASLKLLHLDGHNAEAAIRAAETAKANGVIVSLDAGSIYPGMETLVGLADICIASETFAWNFTKENDAEKAVEKLFMKGKQVAAVTRGDKGVVAITKDGLIRKGAFHVPVVDTTGAGDVFHGAFAFAYIQDWEVNKCLDFASATAAIKCTRLGGRTGIPRKDEVIRFLNEKGISI
jgi:ribokinase